ATSCKAGVGKPSKWATPMRKGGSYFDVVVETDVWRLPTSEWSVSYWREPLTALSDAIFRAGFLVERIVEPQPTDSMLERWPDEHAVLMQRPGFLHLRLLKPAEGVQSRA
ncbi:MAG: hypothetical protein Q7V62_11400, partial [Actinomycetota bacterium]|nr:hypothetical protein [Actinomycetota bacterium]